MPEDAPQRTKAVTQAISIYPRHDQIVRQFAEETNRPYSNAIQFIIEDWARMKRQAVHDAAPCER